MSDTLQVPKFESEAEEARWWFENQDLIAKAFDEAAAAGTLNRGRWKRHLHAKPPVQDVVTMDAADAQLASELAAKRGETYEGFVRRVMHQALQLEKIA